MYIQLPSKQLLNDPLSPEIQSNNHQINDLYTRNINYQPIQMNIKQTISILMFCLEVWGHYIHKVQADDIHISTYANVNNQISIPFKKCFKAEPELTANERYISFSPSSVQLTQLAHGYILQGKDLSLLENLRSPRTFRHEDLLVFRDYALTFISPNTIEVIKSVPIEHNKKRVPVGGNQMQYKVVHKYKIAEIQQLQRLKIYKFNQKALLIVYQSSYDGSEWKDSNELFLLNEQGYSSIVVPNNNFISHLEAIETEKEEFYTSEYDKGIGCYAYIRSSNRIEVLAHYDSKMFNSEMVIFVDVNIYNLKQHKIIYALDTINGVYRIDLTHSQSEPQIDLVLQEPNCNAIDSMRIDQIVLVCQLGSNSYIVEANGKLIDGKMVFERLEPEYHINYFNDLQINSNYFMVFSHKVLNVYWNSKENNIPETVDTQSQLSLPGLETFDFDMDKHHVKHSSYLYTIQSSIMKKYEITESAAKLSIKADSPTDKSFRLSVFGNCEDLNNTQYEQKLLMNISELRGITCELSHTINLQAVEQNSPRKQDFSVSASIIVILIVAFLLVIWICLKKYKGLEMEARRILESYKRKKPRQQLSL